jgi:UDP-GlcNAc:undecaprenyl-phosphate GlcNAc-1-phosphate transferase
VIIFFILNIFASLSLAYLVRKYSKRLAPTQRCSHMDPTPVGGGIIFLSLFFINYFYFFGGEDLLSPLSLILILTLAIVGIIDDFYYLSYKTRLLVQLALAISLVSSGYAVQLPLLGDQSLYNLDTFLTLFLIVGLINACNFFDGLDGLLSGCFLLTIFFSLFFLSTHSTLIFTILIPVMIFYAFNFPQAKIFMGDIGSTFLGFFLALLALLNQQNYIYDTHTALIHKGLIYTLTPMMFAWFDIFFTLLKRIVEGRHLFTPWCDYPFHYLLRLGYSHVKISLFYYLTVIFMSILTYLCMHGYIPFLLGFSLYAVLQIFYIVFILRKHYSVFHE